MSGSVTGLRMHEQKALNATQNAAQVAQATQTSSLPTGPNRPMNKPTVSASAMSPARAELSDDQLDAISGGCGYEPEYCEPKKRYCEEEESYSSCHEGDEYKGGSDDSSDSYCSYRPRYHHRRRYYGCQS